MKEKLIAVVVVLLGLLLIKSNYEINKNESELKLNGVVVQSQPIEKYTEVRNRFGQVSAYEVSPIFTVPNVGDFKCYLSVDEDTFKSRINHYTLDKNGAISHMQGVEIRYLPSDPTVCHLSGLDVEKSWWLMIIGFILIIGTGLHFYNRS